MHEHTKTHTHKHFFFHMSVFTEFERRVEQKWAEQSRSGQSRAEEEKREEGESGQSHRLLDPSAATNTNITHRHTHRIFLL